MRAVRNRNTVADSLATLSSLALAAFVLTMLSVARSVLMPLALAGLLTFLLSPLVARLERLVGRIGAVLVTVALIFGLTASVGWVLTGQVMDLASKLPDYRENIVGKLHSFELPSGLKAFQQTLDEVRSELPAAEDQPVVVVPPGAAPPPGTDAAVVVQPPAPPAKKTSPAAPPPVTRVEVVTTPRADVMDLVTSIAAPVMGPLGMIAVVGLLTVVMLFQRDDLRRRIIRLVGHGHISSTTQALDDASQRVSRYLLMQLVINTCYGVPLAIGLWLIGVPNAFLWGGLAGVLRFVPYVGTWIGSTFPIFVAFAVSPDWTTPLLTIALFVALEAFINSVMEPWLYGASTGVSPMALIVAAVVWTWLWGPLGLVLATPLTVCMVVLGRHVPQFSFLSVLLSDEDALTPSEDLYQRLLTPGDRDETELVESFVNTHSVVEFYDDVLIRVLVDAENDAREDILTREHLGSVHQSIRDIVQDLGMRLDAETAPPSSQGKCRILCLPARAERDELAGGMLAHVLQFGGCEAWSVPAPVRQGREDVVQLVEKSDLDAVVISIVAPSAVLHARYLCLHLRNRFPELRIVVGLWGMDGPMAPAVKRLREAGASAVELSIAEAAAAALPRPVDADVAIESRERETSERTVALRAIRSA